MPELHGHLRAVPRHGQAHRGQAGRPHADHRARLAHRDVGGRGAEDGAARRRPAESGVRDVREETRPGDAGRQRGLGRQRRHLRAVQADRSRRPPLEQGGGADVPEQSGRHRRSLHGDAPRPGAVEQRRAGPRRSSARGADAERHAQGRRGRRCSRRCASRPASRTSGSCTGRTPPASSTTRPACSSPTWTIARRSPVC